MHDRSPFGLTEALLVLALAAVGLATLWIWPKRCTLSLCRTYTGYYRGFGLHNGPGLFGRNFCRMTLPDEDGSTEVDFSRLGWNSFRGTYANGVPREQGECWVDLNGGALDPAPDTTNIKCGKYFDPTGKLVSEVNDGTGVQTYYSLRGLKHWELELKHYKRVRHAKWHPNGQLCQEQRYVDGTVHGQFVTYDQSGIRRHTGAYCKGQRVGKWVEYREDGTVNKETQYPAAGNRCEE